MKCYVMIEDAQNNVKALVAVNAENRLESKYKALRALHADDNLYIVDKESAIETAAESGLLVIDERGCEIDLEADED